MIVCHCVCVCLCLLRIAIAFVLRIWFYSFFIRAVFSAVFSLTVLSGLLYLLIGFFLCCCPWQIKIHSFIHSNWPADRLVCFSWAIPTPLGWLKKIKLINSNISPLKYVLFIKVSNSAKYFPYSIIFRGGPVNSNF